MKQKIQGDIQIDMQIGTCINSAKSKGNNKTSVKHQTVTFGKTQSTFIDNLY